MPPSKSCPILGSALKTPHTKISSPPWTHISRFTQNYHNHSDLSTAELKSKRRSLSTHHDLRNPRPAQCLDNHVTSPRLSGYQRLQRRYASNTSDSDGALPRTALYDLHVANGGKMVPFGGFSMPVQYSDLGIGESHKWTREKASLFDVGHMYEAPTTQLRSRYSPNTKKTGYSTACPALALQHSWRR